MNGVQALCSRPGHSRKASSGFSLLELLVVMVIMTLAAGLVVPRFSQAMSSLELRKSARQVAALLKESRSIAIFEARTVSFTIDDESRRFRSEIGRNSYEIPAGIEMTVSGAFPDQPLQKPVVVFYADGTTTGGTVNLRSATNGYTINVDWLTGTVSIQ